MFSNVRLVYGSHIYALVNQICTGWILSLMIRIAAKLCCHQIWRKLWSILLLFLAINYHYINSHLWPTQNDFSCSVYIIFPFSYCIFSVFGMNIIVFSSTSRMSEVALAVSLGFMAVCCLLAVVGRRVVNATIKSQLIQELFYEAIAAAELCACCFELIIGMSNNCCKRISACIFFTSNFPLKKKFSGWQFRSGYICCGIILFDHLVVKSVGLCNRLPVHIFGRCGRRKCVTSCSCTKNLGSINGRLLCISHRASFLVVWAHCQSCWPCFWRMYSRFTSKIYQHYYKNHYWIFNPLPSMIFR